MGNNATGVEQLFLDNVSVEMVFNLIDRIDYLFLRYIRNVGNQEAEKKEVYLSELAEGLQLPMAEVSKEVNRLQDKGYVRWLMGEKRDRTYVEVTQTAVDLLERQKEHLKEIYQKIVEELGEEETMVMLRSMHRIAEIVKREQPEGHNI